MIQYYHAHLYYNADSLAAAKELKDRVAAKFPDLEFGRMHERPVGPHPVWSMQITVSTDQFADVIPWLCLNRKDIDIFVHPITGDDIRDHTQGVMWLGKSYELNLSGM